MDADRQIPENLTSDYLRHTQEVSSNVDDAQMQEFMRNYQSGSGAETPPPVTPADPGHPLPPIAPKPLRQPTDDALGRIPTPDEQKGGFMRNVAEIPSATVKGIQAALFGDTGKGGAVGWAIDPLAQWLNNNVVDAHYKTEDPQTPTGEVAKSISTFLTGFVPALKGLRALGVGGNFVAPTVAGAVADFATRDPSAGRLSDIWNKLGLPKNILTDYLASKPDDTEIEARFKNALESAGLGALTQGVFLGARFLRSMGRAADATSAEAEYLKTKYGSLSDEELMKVVGDAKAPVVETKAATEAVDNPAAKVIKGIQVTAKVQPGEVLQPKPASDLVQAADKVASGGQLTEEEAKLYPQLADVQKAKEIVSGAAGEAAVPEAKSVYINFARIDEPDQIKFAMGKLADAAQSSIDEARRGVITQEETKKLAGDLGMTVDDLLSRRQGAGFNAEEAVAARQLWAASGEKLVELARNASGKNAGALDQFAFRRQLAIHAAIQAEVIGARTETARALASWAIPAGGDVTKARAIDQIMNAMGGEKTSQLMAWRLARLGDVGASPAAIGRFAEKGAGAASLDAVKEAWVNGLLSNPKTHLVNMFSNTLVAFNSILERGVAGGIASATGGEVHPLEAAASTYGMVEGLKDAWRLAAQAVKTGETSWTYGKVDQPAIRAISSEAFGMSQETGLGRFLDYLGNAVRIPSRLLGAEDEFYKSIGYRMELHAQSLRQAAQEGNTGYALGQRMAELVKNPPEHIMINSADAAMYNTFTNEVGAFGQAMMNLRREVPPVTFVLPFIRTPANIARYAFERTPLAPLVGQWRADIAAGGARADLALAKMATGTGIMLSVMDLADKGVITGPMRIGSGKDSTAIEALQRQGIQPYSFVVNGKSYSYNRADPFGMTMGFAASIAEAVKKGEISEDQVDEWQEVTAMSIAAISQVAINKTYLQGVANLIEVLSDPGRYSQQYVDNMAASFVPGTALMAGVKNLKDPTSREVNSPWEAIESRIAYLSENLTPRRDLWGKEVTTASGEGKYYDWLSPIAIKQQEPTPIDKEMVRLGSGVQRIKKQDTFDGVQANMRFYPHVYDEYTKLAGNELKHPAWGMGAKDYLNAVVSGNHPMSPAYQMLSDESRKSFIQNTIQDYRKMAQQQILADPKYANFASEIQRLKQMHQQSQMPVLEAQ